jgi:adenylate kinase family enzyme
MLLTRSRHLWQLQHNSVLPDMHQLLPLLLLLQVRPCNTALFYNVAEDIALKRLLQRAESSGRVDDNEETIHKRFVVFE